MNTYNIYAIYSLKDSKLIKGICKGLKNKGINLSLEFDSQNCGEIFANQITTQIENANLILFFYSTHSIASIWIRREVEFAHSRNKKVIPIALSPIVDNEWFRTIFGDIKYPTVDPNRLAWSIEHVAILINQILCVHKLKLDDLLNESQGTKRSESLLKEGKNLHSYNQLRKLIGLHYKGGCFLMFLILLLLCIGGGIWDFPLGNKSIDIAKEPNMQVDTILITDDSTAADSVIPDEIIAIVDSFESVVNVDTFATDSLLSGLISENNQLEGEVTKEKNWMGLILSFLAGCICTLILLLIKIRCNSKNLKVSSDVPSRVLIDGQIKKEIAARDVYSTHLNKGEYLIDVEEMNKNGRHRTYNHQVNSNECKLLYANFREKTEADEKIIKCFIAGSKALQTERDALRAVTSIMYNKWKSKRFHILSYTFEDFERSVVIGGQQKKYNDFIKEEANWALFIINGQIGRITLEEYNIAIDAYKRNGKPKILVMAQKGSEQNQNVAEIKLEIDKEKQYWNDYQDINEMKYIFESTLNWDLIELFHPLG